MCDVWCICDVLTLPNVYNWYVYVHILHYLTNLSYCVHTRGYSTYVNIHIMCVEYHIHHLVLFQ